ncbi:MAG: methylenetetrahydrofolate reductase [NAD(P)H] [Acidimicrobiia bacterium]|nr:methylenetetrahydrofolate reductase [NAD(P)H] [Acidimicrobiia bacterium]
MRIGDLYQRRRPVFSFEFFPPKTDQAAEALLATAAELKEALAPDFVSVTYGAGGSTRTRTLECVTRIQNELGLTAMAHLACMGHTADEIREVVGKLVDGGIRNILALRGDPPKDGPPPPVNGKLAHATDLISLLKGNFDVDIGGACYPEVHPEATSPTDDMIWTKEKAQRGARFLITQLFFDNRDYFAFVEKARANSIKVPIVPGIMPVTNVAQIERFTKMCGASIPQALRERLDRHREDPGAVMAVGIEHAITQCRELLERGAPGLHFYTLNKSLATRGILAALRQL